MKNMKWMVYVMILLLSGGVYAGGGKVRGDKGEGDVVQNQVRVAEPAPPFVAVPSTTADGEAEPVLPEYDEMVLDEALP